MGKQFIIRVFLAWLHDWNAQRVATKSTIPLRQIFLPMLCVLGWASTAHAAIPASERAVLTNLYASTNGASWTNKTNWNGAVGTECNWYGVTCNLTGPNVTQIFMNSNNLVGTLPSLGGLTALTVFSVNQNQLTGSIPPLSGLTALRIFYVRQNQLTGSIPSLSGLTVLQLFYADQNQLTGSIPPLNGLTSLSDFVVFNNQLMGSIPSLSGLTALQLFHAAQNQLTGSIPSLSGLSFLQSFQINNNLLSGQVPAAPPSLLTGLSNLCANSLVSSGNAAIDAAWVTAQNTSAVPGGNWLACQTVTPPLITLVSPSSGSASTAVTINGTSLTGATVTVGGVAAIIGSNTATQIATTVPASATVGPGNIVATTVAGSASTPFTVTAPPPTLPPTCTLTAPASIVSGSSSTLTTSCVPAATSFVWTGGMCAGTTSANCTITPTIVGTITYTVRGTNAIGAGNIASATITVTSPPPLFCILSASPAAINPGSTSTLTSSCSTPATSFTWTGGTCAGTTAATCVVTPSATTTYTVTAGTTSATYTASATVTVTPAATAPVCNLIVSPAAIVAGRTSTLTASCNPAATAFSWTGGSCAGTIGATCVVTPTVTTTYTVRGSNAIGIGGFASGTVTIVIPVFPLTVTSSITPTVVNVTAEIRLRPQDAAIPQNVYVFALAPASLVKNIPTGALVDHKGPVTRSINTADTDTACVLAQLINGDLTYVQSTSLLQALLMNVLGSLGKSVDVLKDVSRNKVGGAIFYVGYGPSASEMIKTGLSQNAYEVPADANVCQPEPPQTGWWWYPLQDGRGFGIEVQGRKMFMSGYLYDSAGHATWLVAAGDSSIDGSLFVGVLEQYGNGQTLTGSYKPAAISSRSDAITLSFQNARNGTLIWPGGIIPIQRFDTVIGSGKGVTPSFVPENGWWWNAEENGRGFFMEFKNNFAFMAGYMYEADGRPVWYLAQGTMASPQTFSSKWYQVGNGQTLTGPYRAPNIVNDNVGAISIQFQSATNAILTLPTGRQVTIIRQLYGR